MERARVAGWLVKNRLMIPSLVFFSFVCIFVIGCDPPGNYNLTAPNVKDFQFSQSANDITVYVKPWTNYDVVKKQFNADLLNKQILPVQILIENRSSETVRFSSTQADLAFSRGQVQRAMGEGEIAQLTNDNMFLPSLIVIGTLGYGGAIAGLVGNGIDNKNLEANQTRHELQMSSVIIDSQKMMCGFLFFQSPVDIKPGFTANFVIRRLARDSGGYLTFNIPLSVEKK